MTSCAMNAVNVSTAATDGKKVDCGKLDNDKLRKECRQEKWD